MSKKCKFKGEGSIFNIPPIFPILWVWIGTQGWGKGNRIGTQDWGKADKKRYHCCDNKIKTGNTNKTHDVVSMSIRRLYGATDVI